MAPLGPPKAGPGPPLKCRPRPRPPGPLGPRSPGTDVDGDVVVDEPPVWATATPMPPTRRTPAMTAIANSRRLLEVGLLCSMPPLSALKLGNPAEFSGNCGL